MNVRTLCLGVLTLGEASGYEIKKEIEDGMFSHFIDASFGSIYPALTQLLAEGLLTVRAEQKSGKPEKKVYAITEAGRKMLQQSISVPPARDKFKSEFLFQMLLTEFVTPDVMLGAIDRQLANLRSDLEHIHACECVPQKLAGAAFIAGYGEAVMSASVKYLERKRAELVAEAPAHAAE